VGQRNISLEHINRHAQQVYTHFLSHGSYLPLGTEKQHLQDKNITANLSEFRVKLDRKIGHGYWQLNRLDPDITSYSGRCSYNQNIDLSSYINQEHFILRYIVSGAIKINVKGVQSYSAPQGKISLHHAQAGETINLFYPKDMTCSFVALYLSKSYMEKLCLLLPHENQKKLRMLLDQRFGLEGHEIELSAFDRSQIFQIQNLSASGELKRFAIKSKVRELLSHWLLNFTQCPEPDPTLLATVQNTEKFQKVFDLLKTHYISPPPTKEISRLIGLNQTTLRRGFRATYGKSISSHCLEKRMNRACELLLSKRMNISQISDDLGYAHSTNFTSAFKKYFGVLPKDFRAKDSV
jgi:AraC-like DNA-binding protein|tara:strand:+ start:584 stop:1636 length:1053 start_codon:yes stop_codon:yes gene_type:complete